MDLGVHSQRRGSGRARSARRFLSVPFHCSRVDAHLFLSQNWHFDGILLPSVAASESGRREPSQNGFLLRPGLAGQIYLVIFEQASQRSTPETRVTPWRRWETPLAHGAAPPLVVEVVEMSATYALGKTGSGINDGH